MFLTFFIRNSNVYRNCGQFHNSMQKQANVFFSFLLRPFAFGVPLKPNQLYAFVSLETLTRRAVLADYTVKKKRHWTKPLHAAAISKLNPIEPTTKCNFIILAQGKSAFDYGQHVGNSQNAAEKGEKNELRVVRPIPELNYIHITPNINADLRCLQWCRLTQHIFQSVIDMRTATASAAVGDHDARTDRITLWLLITIWRCKMNASQNECLHVPSTVQGCNWPLATAVSTNNNCYCLLCFACCVLYSSSLRLRADSVASISFCHR